MLVLLATRCMLTYVYMDAEFKGECMKNILLRQLGLDNYLLASKFLST
jgi:hypothetical protein